MSLDRRQFLSLLAATSMSPHALADAYPDRTIRWVVPYPAGGGTDALARVLADVLKTGLGQTLAVENKPGASTNIAADFVARARPDGYTIMSADNAMMAFNEHLFRTLSYSPEKDFTYVGAICRFPLALVVHPDFPAKTVKEFLDVVSRNPGKYNYASPGIGSPHHLAMELLQAKAGLSLANVPYKGAAPAIQDLVGGQVPIMFLDLAAGLGVMQTGRVRVLALGASKRSASLPNVPTLTEAGVPNVEVHAFQGIVGPAGLPAPVVARLNAELNKALANPLVQKRFADFGMEALPGTPDHFFSLARAESQRWGQIIRAANITLD